MSEEIQTEKRKTTLSAAMKVDLFGVEVILHGKYASGTTMLECVADLSKEGQKLKDLFLTVVPSDLKYVLDKIDLKKLEVGVQFSEKEGMQYFRIGTTVEIDGKSIAFQLFRKGDELLVSMCFLGTIGLKSLPLVGDYLPEDAGIEDLQIIYYKKGKSKDQQGLHQIVAPSSLGKHPLKMAVMAEGVNIFAHTQVADFQMPLSFPLEAIQDKPVKKTGNTTALPVPASTSSALLASREKKFLDIRKFELQYKDNRIAVLMSGSVSISIFELELQGLQVSAPLDIFNDFSLKKLDFDLEGLSLNIEKPPFSLTGAFLRVRRETGDDYLGLLNVRFSQYQFTALGAYSNVEGQTSLFVFAFIGAPLGGPPFFFVTGLAFGFGLNRDFILPDISKVGSFPLVKMCADSSSAPSVKDGGDGVLQTLKLLGDSVPPNVGSYFVVAGIRFESFKILKTMAIIVVKFGQEFEINLLGVSSLTLPTAYVELAFSVQFAPAKGIFMARGQLTDRSYLLFPGVKLSGGFAVGLWFAGTHAGDFVVSMGGYHPNYKVPAHYPANIPRIGVFFKLGDYVTMQGELYFALTPQAIMAGISLKLVFDSSFLYASLSIRADFIILWKPFYYEAKITVEAYVKFSIGTGWLSVNFDFHLHAGVEIWGPEFSGRAFLDAGIKTFKIEFGQHASRNPKLLDWEEFTNEFIPEKPCSINISGGLVRKVMYIPKGQVNEVECWIINPKELVLITDSLIPAVNAKLNETDISCDNVASPGALPMGEKDFEATHQIILRNNGEKIISGDKEQFKFQFSPITKNLPKAIWGKEKPDTNRPPDAGNGLLKGALTGFEIRPQEILTGKTRPFGDGELTYEKDFHQKKCMTDSSEFKNAAPQENPSQSHRAFMEKTEVRTATLDVLQEIIPGFSSLDISDIDSEIPVYKYTESFIETRLATA